MSEYEESVLADKREAARAIIDLRERVANLEAAFTRALTLNKLRDSER